MWQFALGAVVGSLSLAAWHAADPLPACERRVYCLSDQEAALRVRNAELAADVARLAADRDLLRLRLGALAGPFDAPGRVVGDAPRLGDDPADRIAPQNVPVVPVD